MLLLIVFLLDSSHELLKAENASLKKEIKKSKEQLVDLQKMLNLTQNDSMKWLMESKKLKKGWYCPEVQFFTMLIWERMMKCFIFMLVSPNLYLNGCY